MGFYWAFIGPFCFVIHLLRDSLPKLQSSTGISGHASKLTKKVFLETSGPKVPGFRGRVSANNVCIFWRAFAILKGVFGIGTSFIWHFQSTNFPQSIRKCVNNYTQCSLSGFPCGKLYNGLKLVRQRC